MADFTDTLTKLEKASTNLFARGQHSVMVQVPADADRKAIVKQFKELYGDLLKIKQVKEQGDHFIRISRKE